MVAVVVIVSFPPLLVGAPSHVAVASTGFKFTIVQAGPMVMGGFVKNAWPKLAATKFVLRELVGIQAVTIPLLVVLNGWEADGRFVKKIALMPLVGKLVNLNPSPTKAFKAFVKLLGPVQMFVPVNVGEAPKTQSEIRLKIMTIATFI